MKHKLDAQLREYYHSATPSPSIREMDKLISLSKTMPLILPREKSLLWFISSQIRFISRKVLALQLMLVCAYGILVNFVLQDMDAFRLLVTVAPLIVLISCGELSLPYRCGMAEVEQCARFSLQKVLLARLCIYVFFDVLCLSCILGLTAMQSYDAFGRIILYGLVPMALAALGSLWFINHSRYTLLPYYNAAYCVALSLVGTITASSWPNLYTGAAVSVWLGILCISVLGIIIELRKMLQISSVRFEQAVL